MRLKFIANAAFFVCASLSRTSTLAESQLRPPPRHHQKRQRRQLATVTYPAEEPLSTPRVNPERGFYTQYSYRSSSPSRLDASSLVAQRDSTGQTVVLRMVYLDSFMSGPVSQSVLDDIEADFGSMRSAGVKCVLRFAYTDVQSGTSEPIKSILLGHIAQLKDILTSNQDAIISLQAGFVGPWGEWHSSTNFNDDLEGRQEILNALLDAVPERNVQVRTPLHKQILFATDTGPTVYSSDHVANGGFEGAVSAQWSKYKYGFQVDTTDVNGGLQSIKVTNGAARQWVDVTAPEGYTVEMSGFSKRVGATGTAPWDYSIYADVKYTDNTYLWGQLAKFSGGSVWEKATYSFEVPAGKTVTGMNLYCMYRNARSGYALFDDVAVTVYAPSTLTGAEAIDDNAFDGSHIARTGHHNDCFLASDTDYGTYQAPFSPSHTEEYDYLAQETNYTAMGGETCHVNPPRSECSKAKEELELFHYTYLNSGYHQGVLDSWISGGCLEEISARLGYRLLLKSGSFGTSAAPSGAVPYSLQIENKGYASPLNKRPFQVVLREVNTGAICAAKDTSEDIRKWFAGETHTVEGNLILPADFPEGTYDLLLNLGDESENLRTNINFKIKVSNSGVNEDSTGLIDLQHSIIVAAGESSSPTNSGPNIDVVCGMEQDVLPPSGPTGLVSNGGFEGDVSAHWSNYMEGYTVDNSFKRSGLQSVKITNGGARQWVPLDATAGSKITIKGYSKAVGTSVGLWDYGIYADVSYSDNSYLWGQIATFPGGTHDFTEGRKSFVVPAGKTVAGLTIYAMYRNDPNSGGVAYFDDVDVIVEAPLIPNGGFESDVSSDWSSYMDGYEVTTEFKHSGQQSVAVTNGGAAMWSLPVHAEEGDTILTRGYSKAAGTTPGLWDYSIYSDIKYSDGSTVWGQLATFPGGSHDWTLAENNFLVPAGKTVTSMNIIALYRNDPAAGTAYFDDVEVVVFESAAG